MITCTLKELEIVLVEMRQHASDSEYVFCLDRKEAGAVTGEEDEPLPEGFYFCDAEYPEEGWTLVLETK